MEPSSNSSAQALQRIRTISLPLSLLFSGIYRFLILYFAVIAILFLMAPKMEEGLSFSSPTSTTTTNAGFSSRTSIQRTSILDLLGWNQNQASSIHLETLSISQRFLLVLLVAAIIAASALLVHHLAALFRLYSRGIVFTPANLAEIRNIGKWLILSYGITFTAHILSQIVASPPEIEINLSIDFGIVICGIIIFVIGHVMSLGCDLNEEHSQIV